MKKGRGVINPTTESRLWVEIQRGNGTSQAEMILGHRGIVLKLAKKYRSGDRDAFEDLIGEGELALCEAAGTFPDKERSCRFSSYVYYRVQAAIVKHLRKDGPFSKSEWEGRKQYEATKKVESELADRQSRGRPVPTLVELADVCGERATREWYSAMLTRCPELEMLPIGPVNGDRLDRRRLPKPTQMVVQAIMDGATLGQMAVEWSRPRSEIEQHARLAMDQLN